MRSAERYNVAVYGNMPGAARFSPCADLFIKTTTEV